MASATLPSAEVPERSNSFARIFGVLFSPESYFPIHRPPTHVDRAVILSLPRFPWNRGLVRPSGRMAELF